MPNEEQITTASGRLFAIRHGSTAKPPVVMVHPLGVDQRFWDGSRSLWQGNRTLITYDHRGAGRSSLGTTPLIFEHQIADLLEVIEATTKDPVIVVGTAYGAMIAGGLAAHHPEKVCGLIMTNAAARFSEATMNINRQRLALVKTDGIMALLPAVANAAFAGLPHEHRYANYTTMFADSSVQGYTAAVSGAMQADITDDLRAIRCNSLIIAGATDSLVTPETSRQLHEALPGSEFHVLENASHFVPYQNPEGFVDLAEDFIQRKIASVGQS